MNRRSLPEANFENLYGRCQHSGGRSLLTPVLEGTDGLLHVTGVYLEGLFSKISRSGSRTAGWRSTGVEAHNFESEEENKKYIRENILYHHESLPMGECAIGTNTTAYAAAAEYGISDRLPILIAEKTGPHFAVGDTCYCRDEDNKVYNPDGKERSSQRIIPSPSSGKTSPEKAYFGCHTDITIPYEELGEFTAVRADGFRTPILLDGRFVLEGTQILNIPLDEMVIK